MAGLISPKYVPCTGSVFKGGGGLFKKFSPNFVSPVEIKLFQKGGNEPGDGGGAGAGV